MNADSSLYSLTQLSQTTPVLKKYYKSKIKVKISYKTLFIYSKLFHFETLTSYFYCVKYFNMNINGGECEQSMEDYSHFIF